MANDKVDTIGFRKENYPDVIVIANRLAELEQRRPHDSIRLLILEEGKNKISRLEQQSQAETTQINKKLN